MATDKKQVVHKWLQANPSASVQEIAAEHGMDEADVISMLEDHSVDESGGISHTPGAGGGWVRPEPV